MNDIDLNFLNSPIEPNLKRIIVPILRKYWRYSKVRMDAIKAARVSRGKYRCNMCKQETFGRHDIQVDHIDPAQTLATKMVTWYDLIFFISRLFVDNIDKLQVLDKICHKIKTGIETKLRIKNRKAKKKSNILVDNKNKRH